MLCIASVLSEGAAINRLNRFCVADTHGALEPFRSKRRLRVGRKDLFFSADNLKSDFVKHLTFNSGSFHCISACSANKHGKDLMGRAVLRKSRIVGVSSGIASIECLLIRFIQWSSEL